ncbi:T9SS type B sorting domain-containing protein [Bizionia myxarmorum]|uniref:Gliding motility-associated C-terminal domain-containing protein n=1 Tax=Bizionia myxarmorum TaxID=291186 RepID=A0A5D0REI6_9FLAO|nr:gliding motility-associated C-terminal domain-containing protein [Bizionia myxarmorum]TYB78964.1 gliding motility-associated C-terminal domain-containing protein [Bizionia myxarmorum]
MKKITLSILFGIISFLGFSQIGLVENFDAGLTLPPGWTGNGYSGSVFQPCSVVSLRANLSNSNMSDDLISPNIVGQSNGTDLTVTFDYKIVDWSAAVDPTGPGWGELNVQYSTNNGATWVSMGAVNDINHQASNTCATMSFVVPAADVPTASNVKLKFENTYYSGNYYFYIDNVRAYQVVVDPPSCSPIIAPLNGATGVPITQNLSWQAATGIPQGYTLSVGTTSGGTELVDNLDVGLSTTYDLPNLDYATTYYVNITPYNTNGPALDCPEFSFTTGADPNAPVDCGSGVPINTIFCYGANDNTTFSFVSSDGSPLVVVFNSGSTENNWDELIVTDSDGSNLYTGYGNAGNLAGLIFTSTGDTITIGVTSDGSGNSCTANPWNFDVACVDTTAIPNCNSVLTTPTNGEVDVSENVDLTWSAATIFVTGYTVNMGTTPGGTDIANGIDVGNVRTLDPGTLIYDQTYYVTIIPYNDNGPAENCNEASFTVRSDPNQIIDCAANQILNTVFCYENGNNAFQEIYSFQSSDGSPLNMFFNSGTIETCCDNIRIEDGNGTVLYQGNNGGDLAGLSIVSITDRLVMFYEADGSLSCSSGSRTPWDFDVSCVDTTVVPNCNALLTAPLNGAVGVDEDQDLFWSAASIFVTGYTINMGITPGGTDVLDGVDVGNVLTYEPGTLTYETTYYVTIIPYNDNGPAIGCTEESFTVKNDPFQIVDCDTNQIINTVFCYENGNNTFIELYSFQSSNGNPLNMFFNSGTLESCCDNIRIEEADGTIIFEGNNGGDLAGLSINSTGDSLVMFYESDGSISCESGSRTPWNFDVSCIDTTAIPNCNAVLTTPVNGSVDMSENVDLTWSSASVLVTGYTLYMGTTPGGTDVLNGVDVGNVLTYDPGTLAYGTTFYVTIVPYNDNGAATGCTEYNFTTKADPNQIVDCSGGALNTTYCYTNNDNTQFNFVSSTGFPLVLEFNAGQVENNWDELIVLDSNGAELYNGYGNNGNLAGLTFTSSGSTITVIIQSDGVTSCSNSNYTPWDFDVYCQTCMPQSVSFDIVNGDCTTDPDNPVFNVEVDIADLGDATSLTITDNQGSAPVEVSVVGPVILGPYTANSNIIVTVANTNDPNCIVISNPLAFLCPPPPNPCSIVYAGADNSVDCITPDTTLSGNFHIYGQDTTSYLVNSIDTCPTPPVDGATPTSVDIDDRWSSVLDLGFEFCFYGGVYDKVIIGSNGVVSFETQHAGTYNEWDLFPFSGGVSTLPNSTNTTITEANIFGVGHDIDPSVCGSIDYVVLGSAPYRQFVVNFNDVCHFSCNSLRTTSQIILHESSNNIDVHVLSKPTCSNWNDGLAVIGIQSVNDQFATTPVGRNTGVWSVAPGSPESYRFSPAGAPNYALEWTDDQGNVIGTDDTVTVSPTQTTDYTFSVTYDLCTGGQATVSDVVNVEYINTSTFDGSFTMTVVDCVNITTVIDGDTGGVFAFSPDPADGAIIDPVTGDITNAIAGTEYSVQYTVGSGTCPAIVTQDITIPAAGNPSFSLIATCDGATADLTGDAGGVFTLNPVPTDGATIDATTGEISNGIGGTSYTVEYSIDGTCPITETQTVIVLAGSDASFTITADCNGAVATITGDIGGVFTLNPLPTDGATINPATGEIINFVQGSTYTVEYTTVGPCPETTSETITIPSQSDATFTMTTSCTGATATITGDMGGVFTFNPVPSDGAVIDAATGEITNGVPGATYTVEYTVGPSNCVGVTTVSITLPTVGDASFTLTANCDGAVATIDGDTGGVFTLNPIPTDGATIDATTGEITNGVGGTMYTVVYTTSGVCAESDTQTVTVLSGGNASFTMTANCDGALATITGDTGGAFSFNPVPADGATIDPITGEVMNVVSGTAYTVEYTTVGVCSNTTAQTVNIPAEEDASFDVATISCYGTTVTITGDTGGTFTFNPVPTDGATINPTSGVVANAVPNTTYTIEYNTSGPCSEMSSKTFTTDECILKIIPEVITPNDDGYNDSFDLDGYDVSSFEVFNRHGVKVFSKTNGYTNEFKGIADNGDELPVGTYFYVMKYQGGKVRTAWVYINK